jgi:hypothetical protein
MNPRPSDGLSLASSSMMTFSGFSGNAKSSRAISYMLWTVAPLTKVMETTPPTALNINTRARLFAQKLDGSRGTK